MNPIQAQLARLFLAIACAALPSTLLPTTAHAFPWTVDGSQILAVSPSLALDGSSNVHLAIRLNTGQIYYYKRVNGIYTIGETVDALTNRGGPQIAVSENGTPNMVYTTNAASPRYLYYTRRVGTGSWRGFVSAPGLPDLIATAGGTPALALDPSGNPHVLYTYTSYPGMELRHTWWNGSVWQTETVLTASSLLSPSIVFDASGVLHVAYSTSNELRYFTRNAAGQWQYGATETVYSAYGGGGIPSIAMTGAGTPCLAFTVLNAQATASTLHYKARNAGGWGTDVVVDGTSNVALAPSLALQNGLARIAYWDKTNADVKAAWECAGGGWNLYTADASPTVPTGSWEPGKACLGLKSNGAPVTYYMDAVTLRTKNATAGGPPSAVTGLAAAFGRTTSTTSWTVPTDGAIADCVPYGYELRMASSPITDASKWNSATVVAQGSASMGTSLCFEQTSLSSCTTYYYFAVKHTDQFGGVSALSNSPGGHPRCTGSIELSCVSGLGNSRAQDEGDADLAAALKIGDLYPNPAHSSAALSLAIPAGMSGTDVSLNVFDVTGRLVRTLDAGKADPGVSQIAWDLRDANGGSAPNGVYFVRVRVGNVTENRRLLLVR